MREKRKPLMMKITIAEDSRELQEAKFLVADRDRRIAELEAMLRDAGGVIMATADLIGGFPKQLAQARRDILLEAAQSFSTNGEDRKHIDCNAVAANLRQMAREVKP